MKPLAILIALLSCNSGIASAQWAPRGFAEIGVGAGGGMGGEYRLRGTGTFHLALGLQLSRDWPVLIAVHRDVYTRALSYSDLCVVGSSGECLDVFPMGGSLAVTAALHRGHWEIYGGISRIDGTTDLPGKANGVVVGIGVGGGPGQRLAPMLTLQFVVAPRAHGDRLTALHAGFAFRVW